MSPIIRREFDLKDRLALIAAKDHMVKRTGKMNSWFSRHGISAITTLGARNINDRISFLCSELRKGESDGGKLERELEEEELLTKWLT